MDTRQIRPLRYTDSGLGKLYLLNLARTWLQQRGSRDRAESLCITHSSPAPSPPKPA